MVYHVVAVPYPGRGHVNPMMNLCKTIVSLTATKYHDHKILITFVATQEWQTLILTNHHQIPHNNIRISTIPNVLPSELIRGYDYPGFYEAVMTKMEAPFESLLDHVDRPVNLIIADTELLWAAPVANRRDIPLALLWTTSASVFSMLLHHELLLKDGHLGLDLLEHEEEHVEYIPGVPSTRKVGLANFFHEDGEKVLQLSLQCIAMAKQAQYILFNSIYELEPQAIDILKSKYTFPLHSIGPSIPYFEINNNNNPPSNSTNEVNYLHWLDSQPKGSVLYISLGSFLSISPAQMEEIVAGVCDSGVRFLLVSRGVNNSWLDQTGEMKSGFVVPWCDQLRVLSHSSVGGFLSHCGWNSVLEAMFSGVPILTFPLCFDQAPNSNQIVEDWKVGWHVKGGGVGANKNVVMRGEISRLLNKFMNSEKSEAKELRKRASEVKEVCRGAIAEGGSSMCNLNAFLQDVLQSKCIKCKD